MKSSQTQHLLWVLKREGSYNDNKNDVTILRTQSLFSWSNAWQTRLLFLSMFYLLTLFHNLEFSQLWFCFLVYSTKKVKEIVFEGL